MPDSHQKWSSHRQRRRQLQQRPSPSTRHHYPAATLGADCALLPGAAVVPFRAPPPTRIVIIPPSSSSSASSSASTVSTALYDDVSAQRRAARLRVNFYDDRCSPAANLSTASHPHKNMGSLGGKKDDEEEEEEKAKEDEEEEEAKKKPLLEERQKKGGKNRSNLDTSTAAARRWVLPTAGQSLQLLPAWLRRKRVGTTIAIPKQTECQNGEEIPRQKKAAQFVYTSSRKANKEARMEQGPREYESCKEIGIDFCARTTSHGIPFVGAHSFFGRPFWACVTAIAFCSFIIQTYFTLSDYLEYRTIIEMQLKFEPAPFPAATICNLNAFKLSEVRKFQEIEQGIQLWEKAISTLNRLKETPLSRRRRQVHYRPLYVRCVCAAFDDQCVPQRNELDRNASVCLCYEDEETGDIWPCYLFSLWKEKVCRRCSNSNTCDDPDQPPSPPTTNKKLGNPPSVIISAADHPHELKSGVPCLCQPISHYCLRIEPGQEIHWWNPNNYTVYPSTAKPPPSVVEQAFGLENLKDRGAITTKTKENLIFLVAGMSTEVRKSLSYRLDEFVLRCSFNSRDCDLSRDFQIQIDPVYGNCWTFNFNDSVELKNSRAGPMYGLRLLLNVNQSDYMPTTEAAGVRIVVHEQDQEPFPDTFGYSAPVGFVSSFGLKTKILNRLDSPYGKCSDTFRPQGYIYAEHYSPEGCYRNCFQHIILERCGCGDPRFPLPNESEDRSCDARNPAERLCLANQTAVLGGFHHLTHDCHCVQPCTEHVFETAYSAAAWPAQNFNIGGDDCSIVLGTNFSKENCTEYFAKNTALIEIYYEQLNYEKLKETPGYTLVNLFSDLGGNIGLWIGFSLITVMEVVELVCECLTFGCKKCIYRPLRKKAFAHRRHSDNEDTEFDVLRRRQKISVDGLSAKRKQHERLFRTTSAAPGTTAAADNITLIRDDSVPSVTRHLSWQRRYLRAPVTTRGVGHSSQAVEDVTGPYTYKYTFGGTPYGFDAHNGDGPSGGGAVAPTGAHFASSSK